MVSDSPQESLEQRVARLEAELSSERSRADNAEQQLLNVREAVRVFKEKQERVIRARKAREEKQLANTSQPAEPVRQAVMPGTGVSEAWNDPDPTLDERLDKYLESSFEPDSSRDWMLND